MEIKRYFTKEILPKKLHDELSAITGPIFSGVMVRDLNVIIILSQEPTTQQDQDILDTVEAHDPTPTAFDAEKDATNRRQSAGIDLYQKIYADLTLNQTFSTVDASISGYDTLLKLRCMLKDGSGKTALRFLVRDTGVAAMLTAEQITLFKGWVRQYCWDHRTTPEMVYSYEQFMGVLDAVETAESI